MSLCDTFDLREPGPRRQDGWDFSPRISIDRPGELPRPPTPSWTKAPVSISGPFATFAVSVSHSYSIGSGEGGSISRSNAYDQCSLAVIAEPRVTVLQRPFYPVFGTFVDDTGKSLTPETTPDGVTPRIPALNGDPWPLLCHMNPPDPHATRDRQNGWSRASSGRDSLSHAQVRRSRKRQEIHDRSRRSSRCAGRISQHRRNRGRDAGGRLPAISFLPTNGPNDCRFWKGEAASAYLMTLESCWHRSDWNTNSGVDSATIRLGCFRSNGMNRQSQTGPPAQIVWGFAVGSWGEGSTVFIHRFGIAKE